MYNFRYHIATLVAVFCALALGLFLGAAIVEKGAVTTGGQALVEGLRSEFSSLREENDTLKGSLAHQNALSTHLATEWVSSRLDKQTILLVASSTKEQGYEEVANAVKSAGGTTVSLLLPKQFTYEKVSALDLPIEETTEDNEAAFIAGIARTIVAELALPAESRPVIDALVKAELIELKGAEAPVAVAGCVTIATNDEVANTLGIALAKRYMENKRPAFAAKVHEANSDIIAAGITAGIPTFDTLEGVAGLQGVVALLTGAPAGNYGIDQGEADWFPVVPQGK